MMKNMSTFTMMVVLMMVAAMAAGTPINPSSSAEDVMDIPDADEPMDAGSIGVRSAAGLSAFFPSTSASSRGYYRQRTSSFPYGELDGGIKRNNNPGMYSFGLGKRGPPGQYGFGLGKRPDSEGYWADSLKRNPQQHKSRFGFGLGKRSGSAADAGEDGDFEEDNDSLDKDSLLAKKRAYYPSGAAGRDQQSKYQAYLRSFSSPGRRAALLNSGVMDGSKYLSFDKRPVPVYNFGLGK